MKIPWRVDIPEVLDAKRHKTHDRGKNTWYLVVSEYEKKPVELFMTTTKENDHSQQDNIANLTALTRLISLMLRHIFLAEKITFQKIQSQLRKSSRQTRDLPDMVLGVLSKYLSVDPL